jgi:hypothetical protein
MSKTSVSLISKEAEILAATSLLTEGIHVKQVLQFLVNDKGGLGSQSRVTMQLRLNSTSAQAFFTRLGPGKAKTFVNTFAVNETSNDASMV